ncbi:kinase-like domain-containing protein [Gigaspora rosea]|uniref:Kinase-like domain-containing protein n=1 Tax=Gigaspora rosea TaxID=44941 RepID=A0A397V8K0_9GLOM|nr:kinase-like domain-containing protein [Gigaspora rosea]
MVDSEELFKNTIDEGCIRSYDYSEFSVHKLIGNGGFGIVYEAKWKSYGLTIALKRVNLIFMDEKTIQRFAKELKNLRKVCKHPNIIEFYGVTRANNGDLREYLKINFSKLEWTDKLRMAHEISAGLEFLHKNDIIHRDLHILMIQNHQNMFTRSRDVIDQSLASKELVKPSAQELKFPLIYDTHSKNILVHDEKMLIADFGSSKDETSKTSNDSVHGVKAYIDPQCFENVPYKRSKKSDIYSFGVILWEISKGTPVSYIQIYERCWNYDPNRRPELEEISRKLMDLSKSIELISGIQLPTENRSTSSRSPPGTPPSVEILGPLKFTD